MNVYRKLNKHRARKKVRSPEYTKRKDARRKARQNLERLPDGDFSAYDTETQDGKAVLVCTEKDDLVFPQSFDEIIEWLRPGFRYVCWNSDYDVRAILKFLPDYVLKNLFLYGKADTGSYNLKYLPKKCFTVFAKEKNNQTGLKTVLEVYDLSQFYNRCRLETAAQKEFSEGKHPIPKKWLNEMAACLRDKRAQTVKRYCRRDAFLTNALRKVAQDRFREVGVSFDRPISQASLARSYFKDAFDSYRIDAEVNNWFRLSYRGGRIEVLKYGYQPEGYYYDIHSAYSSTLMELELPPSVWKKVERGSAIPSNTSFGVFQVSLNIPTMYMSPLALVPAISIGNNPRGILVYATGHIKCWVDWSSFQLIEPWITRVWQGRHGRTPEPGLKPFAALATMYEERKKHPELSWAIKTLMNSSYGKLAQTQRERIPVAKNDIPTNLLPDGVRGRNGDYGRIDDDYFRIKESFSRTTNFIWASEVTSRIRLRMWRELDHSSIVFTATDGIISTRPQQLDLGPNIGQWGYEGEVKDVVAVQSGVYTYRHDEETECRFRGFTTNLDLYKILDTEERIIPVKRKKVVGLSECVFGGRDWADMNKIEDENRYLAVGCDYKRQYLETPTKGRQLLDRSFDTVPFHFKNTMEGL